MTQRTERIAGMILREVSAILREDLHNPRIGFLTLLGVDVSPDLKSATIRYSVLGADEEKKDTDIELRNSSKFIKKLLNDRIKLRFAVDLRFVRETGIDESFRIQGILDKIRREQEAREKEDGANPAG